MTDNINDPTFTELRHEAQSTMCKLIKANDGLIGPEAVLHLGMFFGMISKQFQLDQIEEDKEKREREWKRVWEVVSDLDIQSYDSKGADKEMVHFSDANNKILHDALSVLQGTKERA